MAVLLDNADLYLRGAWVTVQLTALSFVLALLAGTVVAVCRVSPVPPLRAAATLWVETLRNTPLVVLFVLFVFGLTKVGISYSFFVSAVIVLTAYTSTFVAETVRAGISSVPSGQAEASRALGLGFGHTLSLVVLPQALRTVVAPLASILIALLKNSGIAAVISVVELTSVSDKVANDSAQSVAFLGGAVLYVALGLVASTALGVLERRVAIKR